MPTAASLPSVPLLTQKRRCSHCNSPLAQWNTSTFCHSGCERVHALITDRGLEQFYELKKYSGPSAQNLSPAQPAPDADLSDFSTFDSPEFKSQYAIDETHIQFYLDGVHCAGCVYLIEQLPQYAPSVAKTHFDFGRSIATVELNSQGSFSEAARELQKMGYMPHPIRGSDHEALEQKEMRTLLVRTGVAAACAANLMLMAVPIYSGVDDFWLQRFRVISLFIYLPVLFYSSVPFYVNCWRSWKSKSLSIDVPVMLAVLIGSAFSIWGVFFGAETLYFDSLASLIFLLLASRYALKRAQSKALSHSRLIHFLSPLQAHLKTTDGNSLDVPLTTLKPGDTVIIPVGERIPGDGTVAFGKSRLDCSLLTGESESVLIRESASVFAGTLNLENPIEVTLTHSPSKSRLGKLLEKVESQSQDKPALVRFTDTVARFFIVTVLSTAAVVFSVVYSLYGFHEALERTLAFLIVTCPCSLALATPLAFTLTMGKAAQKGILIKNPDVFERILKLKTIFLDKTGTLTEGRPSVISAQSSLPESAWAGIVLALESRSQHPWAKALCRYASSLRHDAIPVATDISELLGKGISGTIEQKKYALSGVAAEKPTVILTEDGVEVARFILGDQLRPETPSVIRKLKSRGLKLVLLSGDPSQASQELGAQLNFDQILAPLSPEEKANTVASEPFSLMVGDGANDAMAMKNASVGFATQGAMAVSLAASDAYSRVRGLDSIEYLFRLAEGSNSTARRNLKVSIFYNLVGASLAVTGHMTPLGAAVLMPLNAASAFLSTVWGIQKHDPRHGPLSSTGLNLKTTS